MGLLLPTVKGSRKSLQTEAGGRRFRPRNGYCTFLITPTTTTTVMIPSAWELYPEGTLHFQQDNHPLQSDQQRFNRRPDIELLEWPPNSPDMNPIENVWARVMGILRSDWAEPPAQTSDELWNRVLNAWQEVATDVELFHNLVDSLPRRMRAIFNAGGLWTKY